MKKQVLTSAMALAMLAPTVSAFATTVGADQSISDQDTNTPTAEMKVNGQVRNKDGAAPEGRIEVSLPTSVSFVVDQAGNVQTPSNISVKNSSQCDIMLSVANFVDSTPKTGIVLQESNTDVDQAGNVQTPSNISVKNSSQCDIMLSVANFVDSTPKTGIVLQESNTDLETSSRSAVYLELIGNAASGVLKDGLKMSQLALVKSKSTEGLTLLGEAGKAEDSTVDNDGVTDDFTITFQVKKYEAPSTDGSTTGSPSVGSR